MEDTAITPETVDGPQAQESVPETRLAELEAALEAAKAEASANWDKYLRERAEMDNYKKRIERTYADLAKRGRRDLLLKLLGPIDNLDRALAFDADPQHLVKGLRMIHSQFKDLLAGEGLTEIKTVGEKFDPAVHEAIATAPVDGKEEGEIVEEVQKGYTLGEDLLRPALVKVAAKA